MPRIFKQWTPATAELELLHECWLARLTSAKIAARLCISEPKLTRFMRRVHAAREMPRPEPARPRQPRQSVIKRRGPAARAHIRRMSGADGGLSFSWGAAVRTAPSRSRLSQIDPKFARNQKPILGIE
jgi:hypothetical protein